MVDDGAPMQRRDEVPLTKLAELYGVVVTPEEARRFYRRDGWFRIGLLWGSVLLLLLALVLVKAA
jgi:hypothetical protein